MESMKKLFAKSKAPASITPAPIGAPAFGAGVIKAYGLNLPSAAPPAIDGLETMELGVDAVQFASKIFELLPISPEEFPGQRFIEFLSVHAFDFFLQSFRIHATFDPIGAFFDTKAGRLKTQTCLADTRDVERRMESLKFDFLVVFSLSWLNGVFVDPNGKRWIINSATNDLVYPDEPCYEPKHQAVGARIKICGFDSCVNIRAGLKWRSGVSELTPSKARDLNDFAPNNTPLSFIKILLDAEREVSTP
jgi:hypothetical protein